MTKAPTVSRKPIRIVFAGTPDFAVPSLRALAAPGGPAREIVAVYTQPDRPAGRGRRLRKSDVKQLAESLGLRIEQPATLRDAAVLDRLRGLQADILIVAAYGLIFPQAALDIPRLGCVNVHASLLPRWRGAAPVQRAILAGDRRTGVTLMQMDAGLDTGDMLARRETPIGETETGGELTDRLAQLGADLLTAELAALLSGDVRGEAQDDRKATLAPKIKKREALIDWDEPASRIAARVRAFNPWPVAETRWQGRQLRIWSARPFGPGVAAAPGAVVAADADGIRVATGRGELLVQELQPAGKRVMSARDFLNAHEIAGATLGETDNGG